METNNWASYRKNGLDELKKQNYAEAKSLLLRSLEISKNANGSNKPNTSELAYILLDIGVCYRYLGNFTTAREYFKLSLKLLRSISEIDISIPTLYNNIADIDRELGSIDKAKEGYEQAIAYARQNNIVSPEFTVWLSNLATIEFIQGDISKSLELLQAGERILDLNGYPENKLTIFHLYCNLAVVFSELNDSKICLKYLKMAINFKNEESLNISQNEIEGLMELYEKNNI